MAETNLLETYKEAGLDPALTDPVLTEILEGKTISPDAIRNKKSWTVDELLSTEFPEPNWAIPGIVPEGLTILGGRPKKGKSFLALQMSIAIATGGMFFDRKIDQGEVLYYALEDNPRRLKDRLNKMGVKLGTPITFLHNLSPLHEGGISELYMNIKLDRFRFIVVDTLAKASRGIDQNKQGIMSRVWPDIQSTAINHNVPLKFIDHTRKPMGFNVDPIDDIIASTIKTGAADAVLAIYTEPGKAGAKLLGRGREMEDVELRIHWDPLTFCFQCDGNANEIQLTESKQEVIDTLNDLGKCQLNDIANTLGKDRSNIYRTLVDLVNDGKVRKEPISNKVYYEKR